MNARQEINRQILELLTQINARFPDLRFSQLLHAVNIEKLDFNEESSVTLDRLYKAIERLKLLE
jgi:hypothetical protein